MKHLPFWDKFQEKHHINKQILFCFNLFEQQENYNITFVSNITNCWGWTKTKDILKN